ncbi:hypothetical protein [Halomonas gemina]|uniref:hypothetical protein n=1 Tax=Halomonas gemina TaxID=2945105 RepID=UPI0024C3B3AC|nr:hypothetical protein [Halomonas gemina]
MISCPLPRSRCHVAYRIRNLRGPSADAPLRARRCAISATSARVGPLPRRRLRQDCRAQWAQYFVRFVQALREEGFSVWGVTVQNEPEAAVDWSLRIGDAAHALTTPAHALQTWVLSDT